MLAGNSAAADQPLKDLVASGIDRDFLDEVGAEYANGRLLMIDTADLDACQGAIWSMTRIAASNDPRALDLFHPLQLQAHAQLEQHAAQDHEHRGTRITTQGIAVQGRSRHGGHRPSLGKSLAGVPGMSRRPRLWSLRSPGNPCDRACPD
jgi:hypothetical protein